MSATARSARNTPVANGEAEITFSGESPGRPRSQGDKVSPRRTRKDNLSHARENDGERDQESPLIAVLTPREGITRSGPARFVARQVLLSIDRGHDTGRCRCSAEQRPRRSATGHRSTRIALGLLAGDRAPRDKRAHQVYAAPENTTNKDVKAAGQLEPLDAVSILARFVVAHHHAMPRGCRDATKQAQDVPVRCGLGSFNSTMPRSRLAAVVQEFECGLLTLDAYVVCVAFNEPRSFTREAFTTFV